MQEDCDVPYRENIHVLDPVLIAIQVASTPVMEYVDVDNVLKRTISNGKPVSSAMIQGMVSRMKTKQCY